jgi:hypothetical protein
MKKIQKKLLLFGILLVFAISCVPERPVDIRVHEGTEGLKMDFLESSPPDEVYVGDIFPVTLDMQNKGAYDIERGVIALGIEEGYVEIRSPEYMDKLLGFDILGRSAYDPIGGIDRKTIVLKARGLDPQSETHTTTVAVTTCYPYKTEATAHVCVDTDIYGQRQAEKVCTPQTLGMGIIKRGGQELPRGQGAPIAITKIEQKMMMHPENDELIKPQFMIYVKNMGDGLPIDVGVYEEACTATGISNQAWNVVGARVYLSDRSVQLNCTPKLEPGSGSKAGYIKLEKQEDFIKCTLEEGISKAMGTYTTPLMIDLIYGYTFTISKEVLIRRQV